MGPCDLRALLFVINTPSTLEMRTVAEAPAAARRHALIGSNWRKFGSPNTQLAAGESPDSAPSRVRLGADGTTAFGNARRRCHLPTLVRVAKSLHDLMNGGHDGLQVDLVLNHDHAPL